MRHSDEVGSGSAGGAAGHASKRDGETDGEGLAEGCAGAGQDGALVEWGDDSCGWGGAGCAADADGGVAGPVTGGGAVTGGAVAVCAEGCGVGVVVTV
ncbi:hypothetical protein [Streptomyces sp. NPDC017529]|uniref:hypothetical protein n=1 Tax=Streptomyces sp. NPDC017529 TaxID=3365000 RepID=UPI0037A62394